MDAMARRLEVGKVERTRWRAGAWLHDVGKLLLPRTLLEAPGPLRPEEREFLRRHVKAGEALLRVYLCPSAFTSLLSFVRLHHERYDGEGYPFGLKGDDLPFEVALLSVADAYAAMREDRPYQGAKTHDQALEELVACAGRQFHPRAVEIFLATLGAPAARYSPSSSALISSMNRSTLSNSRYTLANRM